MAQQLAEPAKQGILRRIFGRHNFNDNSFPESNEKVITATREHGPKPQPEGETRSENETEPEEAQQSEVQPIPRSSHGASPRPTSSRRTSYNVIPGLPRAQTFKRQLSEQRTHLEPVQPTHDERRALSMDRRSVGRQPPPVSRALEDEPRVSAPDILVPEPRAPVQPLAFAESAQSQSSDSDRDDHESGTLSRLIEAQSTVLNDLDHNNVPSMTETHSVADSCYDDDDIIARELDTKWILNLSMHFRDRSKREKFFVTYRQKPHTWRRVTISLDYRNAPPDSLEAQLDRTRYQRDKIAKIYEAIRESLDDIQFYDTVTNLKLQTLDGRLYVHVMEDGNEIIRYPPVREVRHLHCTQVRERDIVFDSHMSGFVYKVKVGHKMLIKKEIPSPETVDEFLYEINALHALSDSPNVIDFYGVVVDDHSQMVKGLLIDYADRGTLIDILYEHREHNIPLPWETREKWARQIVQGLADVHESGFVQGDFTLSNIVITQDNDARIIDINRRGCPVGWEPPEAAALIESGHRIAMYIGVKSDLYQLGMVLWAIAVLEDEPEMRGRPLFLGPEDNVPDWYRQLTEICLSPHPKSRLQAVVLMDMFPPLQVRSEATPRPRLLQAESTLRPHYRTRSPSEERRSGLVEQPSSEWSHVSRTFTGSGTRDYGSSYYPPRGRSPPSRQPSTPGDYVSPRHVSHRTADWCDDVGSLTRSHYSDESVFLDQGKPPHDISKLPPDNHEPMVMDESAQTLRADTVAGAEPMAHGGTNLLDDPTFAAVDTEVVADDPQPVSGHTPPIQQITNSEGLPVVPLERQEATLAKQPDRDDLPESCRVGGSSGPPKPHPDEKDALGDEGQDLVRVVSVASLGAIRAQSADVQDPEVSADMAVQKDALNIPAQLVLFEENQTEPPQDNDLVKGAGNPSKPQPGNQNMSIDVSAGSQSPRFLDELDLPVRAECTIRGNLDEMIHTTRQFSEPLQSQSAPMSRRVTDESMATLHQAKAVSDGLAAPSTTAADAPRSHDPGSQMAMGFRDMSDCLAGIGGGLSDATVDKVPSFNDDFSILGRPPHLMISTDAKS